MAIPIKQHDHLAVVGKPGTRADRDRGHVGRVGLIALDFEVSGLAVGGGEAGAGEGDGEELLGRDGRAVGKFHHEIRAERREPALHDIDVVVVVIENFVGQIVVAQVDRGRAGIVDLNEFARRRRHRKLRDEQMGLRPAQQRKKQQQEQKTARHKW
ncbi:hypothetical protein HUU39_24695 [candidate division KSB1 bacterium]|nr:hypothetical protein [candidate division KSB1 bacterium]